MLRSLIKYFDFAKIDIFTDTESIHLDQKKSKNNSFALILSFVYIKYERKKVFTHIWIKKSCGGILLYFACFLVRLLLYFGL